MECIRLINPKKFDRKSNKWFVFAFRNSSDGSLSVLDHQCIHSFGNTICSHVRKYWTSVPGIVGEPIIFWKFYTEIFECDYRVEQQTANNGDVCHVNIWNVT